MIENQNRFYCHQNPSVLCSTHTRARVSIYVCMCVCVCVCSVGSVLMEGQCKQVRHEHF